MGKKRMIGIVLIGALLLGGAIGTLLLTRGEATGQISRVEEYVRDGRYEEAIRELKEEIRRHPTNLQAYDALLKLYARQRRYEEAIELLKKGIKNNPREPSFHFNLGQIYYRMGEIEKAYFAWFQEFLMFPHTDFATHSLQSTRQVAEAYAGKIDIRSALYQFLKGFSYGTARQWSQAIPHYRKALARDPNNFTILVFSAAAHRQDGQLQKALSLYERALKVEPDVGAVYFEKAITFQQIGDEQRAGEAFRKTIEFAPTAFLEAYIELGNIYHRQGRYLDAITQFKKVVEIAPDSIGALASHYNAGRAYYALDIKEKAEKHFREVIRLAPDSELAKLAQKYIEKMK